MSIITVDGIVARVGNNEVKDLLKKIEEEFEYDARKIQYLETQNKLLRDSAYKDIQLAEMKDKLDTMTDEYYRGFPITKEEQVAIYDWMHEHDAECKGGNYRYIFVPTGIGTIGHVQCGKCNAEFAFQDL